jgi:virulence-associated protein VapD
LDMVDAFLNAKLVEKVYMVHPHGFGRKGTCCRLLRALFGLCQSPREWWLEVTKKLAQLGFKQCKGDASVYINTEGVIIILYVDDIALFADSKDKVEKAKQQLMGAYRLRDLGSLQTFIGIQILRLPGKVFVHQTDYCKNMLEKFGFTKGRGAVVPYDDGIVLRPRQDQCPTADLKRFQEMNGSMGWLVNQTRPDAAYAYSKLAQFNANPPVGAIEGMNHLYRYFEGCSDLGIIFSDRGNESLVGHTDSNHGDKYSSDLKSTSAYTFSLAGGPISWSSRKQRTTATSSTEAEYIAQCNATKEAFYLRQLLDELGESQKGPTVIHGDNQAAIALAKSPAVHVRSRHIDFQYHYTREKVNDGAITLSYLPTGEMVADGMTKPLKKIQFERFRRLLGMVTMEEAVRGYSD